MIVTNQATQIHQIVTNLNHKNQLDYKKRKPQ
jgi:hypothetical protein